jgi:hypothetical protein
MGLAGVTFHKPGDYSFEVVLADQHLKSVPLFVMEAPQPPRPEQMA